MCPRPDPRPGPARLDGAREIPAEPGPIRLVHQPEIVEDAGDHTEVDGVDRRRGDLYPQLAGTWLDHRDIDDLDRVRSARSPDNRGTKRGNRHENSLLLEPCGELLSYSTMDR